MRKYLLNSPVLTDFGLWRFEGPLSLDQARAWAGPEVVSAIGHAATAALLGELLGHPVEARRVQVALAPGDEALVFRLLGRLPEGAALDHAALARLPWQLGLLSRLA